MLTIECANIMLYQRFTAVYSRLPCYGTALPEEQLGQHEILRAPSGLRTRPQDDIVEQSSTVGSASAAEHRRFPRKTVRVDGQMRFVGLRPLHPCIASANTAFSFFVHIAISVIFEALCQ